MTAPHPSYDEHVSESSPLLRTTSANEGPADTYDDASQKPSPEIQVSTLQGVSIASALFVLIFLQTSNISLLTTIQSPIADDLDAYGQVSWFTSAYLIAMSATTPLAGRMCQIFLPQSYVLASSIVCAGGLVATSVAPTLPWFLFGRALTGVGAAGNFPVGIIVIVNLTSLKRRGLFMGLLNTCFTFGVAFGAVMAGALEPAIGWRAVFLTQIPILLLAGVVLFFAMPRAPFPSAESSDDAWTTKLRNVDYLGVLTLVPFIVLLLLGLSSPMGIQLVPLLLSVVFLVAFIAVESYSAATPIIMIDLLRSRPMLMTCFATLLLMMSRWSVLFYTPIYTTAVRTWPPARAGSILIATNGGFAVGGLLAGWLHIRRAGSFYVSCLVTFLLFTLALFLLGEAARPDLAIWYFVGAAFANGFFTGAALNYTIIHLFHVTDASTHFVATSVVATFRGFAGSFGSSIGGGIFARVLRSSLINGFAEHGLRDRDGLVQKLLGSPRLVGSLEGVERDVAIAGYADAVKALFQAAAALALIATVVQAGTGWRASAERHDRADAADDEVGTDP